MGIENRIGYNNFLGAVDHSGLPYTSLMPRRLASMVLQHSKRNHHRMQLNSKREYRTYSYSELGYRKILGKSGFPRTSLSMRLILGITCLCRSFPLKGIFSQLTLYG